MEMNGFLCPVSNKICIAKFTDKINFNAVKIYFK